MKWSFLECFLYDLFFNSAAVVGQQRMYSRTIVDNIKNKPVWLSDPATYPVIFTCGFACAMAAVYSKCFVVDRLKQSLVDVCRPLLSHPKFPSQLVGRLRPTLMCALTRTSEEALFVGGELRPKCWLSVVVD